MVKYTETGTVQYTVQYTVPCTNIKTALKSRKHKIPLYISRTTLCSKSDVEFYLSNKARRGVLYGQYITVIVVCLDTALSRGILAICHKPQRGLIAIINWLPT